jgi:hypothetical protein
MYEKAIEISVVTEQLHSYKPLHIRSALHPGIRSSESGDKGAVDQIQSTMGPEGARELIPKVVSEVGGVSAC